MPTVVRIELPGGETGEALSALVESLSANRRVRCTVPFYVCPSPGGAVGALAPGTSLSEVLIAVEAQPGAWRVGVGFGPLEGGAGNGGAARSSLLAAGRADRSLAGVAVEGDGVWVREVDASASVLMHLLSGRSERQRLVVALRREGLSAEDAAERLDITRRAVHKHLVAAGYAFEAECRRVLDRLAGVASGEPLAGPAVAVPSAVA